MGRDVAILACAGDGERWGDYQGVPKHLVSIEGETLVERTVRLLKEHADSSLDIHVVARSGRWQTPGAHRSDPHPEMDSEGAWKFLGSRHLWSEDGSTYLLFGDVWFSGWAIESIVGEPVHDWQAIGRMGCSAVTGKAYGEIFGHRFDASHIPETERSLDRILEYERAHGAQGMGWGHYRSMMGYRPEEMTAGRGRFLEIDDFTEDFDFPEDLDVWFASRKRALSPLEVPVGDISVSARPTARAVDAIAHQASGTLRAGSPFWKHRRKRIGSAVKSLSTQAGGVSGEVSVDWSSGSGLFATSG